MVYDCIASSRKKPNTIVLFGIVRPVSPYSEKRVGFLAEEGLSRYCSARDQYGNMYELYTDYDPCLRVSHAVALLVEEVTA
jgi:hypothetical protein